MEKAVNSAITKLGTLLNLTPTNSLPTGKKKKAPAASANTSSTSGATIVSPSEEALGSPPRRRKSTQALQRGHKTIVKLLMKNGAEIVKLPAVAAI
mmetsp:Transcript_29592/g.50395  ORF Transcript_29592/g.50395 Transcript_29592/m.50395 type:complete len:96 (+) Transcript_29592:95-382(+)